MYKAFHSFPLGKVRDGVCILTLLLVVACHKDTKAVRYAREAIHTTAQCPMAMDANTTLDSMTYTASLNRFTYYYMVNGISDSILIAGEQLLRQQVIDRLLNATDMIPYLEDGVSFRYVYRTSPTPHPLLDFTYENPSQKK